MADNSQAVLYTGLYPSGYGHITSFNVKSDFIKVFPSSWRGAKFLSPIHNEEGTIISYTVTGNVQFNPESALNTEYNITHTAGGLKSFIESVDTRQETIDGVETTLYDIKFFINGYAFEIFSLDLTRYLYDSTSKKFMGYTPEGTATAAANLNTTDKLNLWASIRVGDLNIGSADLDDTKVLMPYYWNALNTPIPLDATLRDAYLIDEAGKTTFDQLDAINKLNGGANPTNFDQNDYIFTGLVLSTAELSGTAKANADNYLTIQLFKDGKICTNNFWPTQVRAGNQEGKSTVIGDESLEAPINNMLAIGKYNSYTESETGESTIFAVGNGTDEDHRRNAFEILGKADNGTYSHTVRLGGVEFKNGGTDSEEAQTGNIDKIGRINSNVEIAADGSYIAINKPLDNGTYVSDRNIGLHTYGNVNIHSITNDEGKLERSKLQFTRIIPRTGVGDIIQDSDEIISEFKLVDVATGLSNIIDPEAIGLKMTNIHEINEKALVFKPRNAGIDRNKLRSINDNSIGIDDDTSFKHSIEIGRLKTESAALEIGGGSLILKSDPTSGQQFINKVRIGAATGQDTKNNLYNVAGIYYNNNDTSNTEDGTFPGVYFTNNQLEIKLPTGYTGLANNTTNTNPEKVLGQALRSVLLDFIYPVGSIYICTDPISPEQKFGGEWQRISQGRMLVGAGEGIDSQNIKRTFTVGNNNNPTSYYEVRLQEHTHTGSFAIKINPQTTSAMTWDDTAATFTTEEDGAHLHVLKDDADATDTTSIHKHNIPVSLYDYYETEKMVNKAAPTVSIGWSWFGPTFSGGVTSYTDTKVVTDIANARLMTHPDGFASFEGANNSVINRDYFRAYETLESRKTWQSRYKYMFEDRAKLMIPTVRVGAWLADYHCFNWNEPGPVYTGYQYVTDNKTEGNAINSFEEWRWTFDKCFRDWFLLAIEDTTKSGTDHRFIHTYQETRSEYEGDITTNDLYPSYWNNDTDNSEIDRNNPGTWIKHFEPGYVPSNYFNDYCIINRKFVVDKAKAWVTKLNNNKVANKDIIQKCFGPTAESAPTWGNAEYGGAMESINQTIEFNYLWEEFFKLDTKLGAGVNNITLQHVRAWLFGLDDDWKHYANDDLALAQEIELKQIALTNFQAMWNRQKTENDSAADPDWGTDTTIPQANNIHPGDHSASYAPYAYGLFFKPDDIKEQAIRDWLAEYARGTEAPGDAMVNERGFTFRKDDGQHTHKMQEDGAHTHSIRKSQLTHEHTLSAINIASGTAGNTLTINKTSDKDNNTSNLPPYFVCYIWKRTK